jgi:phage replication initiation protein
METSKVEQKKDKPPTCNTGAQNTQVEGLRACVDWVSCTFKSAQIEIILDVLNMTKTGFIEMANGLHGYRKQLRKGHIKILYDGHENMGVHLEMSGQGCREFEREYPYTWSHFFNTVLINGGHFTRIDAAIDDFKGYFTIESLVRKIKRGEALSRFKSARSIEKIKIEDGSSEGYTVYFGSPQSRIKIRFYDKLQERIGAGKEIEEGIRIWNRTEIEMRNERADIFAMILVGQRKNNITHEHIYIGKIVSGILKNYVRFLVNNKDKNKARWNTAPFWEKFLGEVEKVRLTEIAPDKTLGETKKWFEKQLPRTMGKIFLALNSDIDYFVNILNVGMEKLDQKDLMSIEYYKSLMREEFEKRNGYTNV